MAKIKIPAYKSVEFTVEEADGGKKGVDILADGEAILHINTDGSFMRVRGLDTDLGLSLNERGQILLTKEAR